jgi:hypothetical protein
MDGDNFIISLASCRPIKASLDGEAFLVPIFEF